MRHVETERDGAAADYVIRAYRVADRVAVSALGVHVIDWWHGNGPQASLHLVAAAGTGEVVGHAQAVDRSVPEPSRRPGQCHFALFVAPEHRGHGIGGELYSRIEVFAK